MYLAFWDVVFLDFVSDAVYVDLKYDDVCVLWLIGVCEWFGGYLSTMGYCVVCAWCCCYDLCGCVYGTSPVRLCIVAVLSVCRWTQCVLSVLGVVVTIYVGMFMVYLQSDI